MPLAWDCRNTKASKNKQLKKNIGDYAFTLGIALMNMNKIPYPEMYLHTLEITEKNADKLTKYITEKEFFNNPEEKRKATLEENEILVKQFIGSKFTRTG